MPPLADAAGDRHRLLLDRRHDRVKHHAGQFSQAPFKTVEITVRSALRQQGRVVGAGHRAIARVRIVTNSVDFDLDPVVVLPVGADMGKG
jgi:hypothetical protein